MVCPSLTKSSVNLRHVKIYPIDIIVDMVIPVVVRYELESVATL